MRIAHIEAGRHLYGGAAQVGYLLEGLADRGVDNLLICPPGSEIGAAAEACSFARCGCAASSTSCCCRDSRAS